MFISIIIPTYNESKYIGSLLSMITANLNNDECEIIVVDGGSIDNTISIAQTFSVTVITSSKMGRAAQMNFGATIAKGQIFYFVHADVQIQQNYFVQIKEAITGCDLGCYQYDFSSNNKLLKFNAYMTRFNTIWAGGGDQTLFIKKEIFQQLGGFREDFLIMEDFDLVKRAKQLNYKFKILPYKVIVSARKYDKNNWVKVQFANTVIVLAWKMGASQQWMKKKYTSWLG
jgi:rSAM/selenodomain-associated transferase 2